MFVEFAGEVIYLVLGFSLRELLKITNLISSLVIGLYRFLFLLESVLILCIFLEMYPFCLGIKCVAIQLFIVFLYKSFNFCNVGNGVLSFILDFGNLSLPSLFLIIWIKSCQHCQNFPRIKFWDISFL